MINKASLLKFLLTILIALAGLLSLTCQDQNSALTGRNKESAIAATLKWARLAPFPVSADQVIVTTEGNIFTRTFRVHFRAKAEDIGGWVQASPGLSESTPISENGYTKYSVKPGGGANQAEVIISNKGFPPKLAAAAPRVWRFCRSFSLDYARSHAARGNVAGVAGQAAAAVIEEAHAISCERGQWVCNEKRLIEAAGLSNLNDLFAEIPIERKRLLEWVDLVAERLGVQRSEPTPWKSTL